MTPSHPLPYALELVAKGAGTEGGSKDPTWTDLGTFIVASLALLVTSFVAIVVAWMTRKTGSTTGTDKALAPGP